jgi:hypothetical protein
MYTMYDDALVEITERSLIIKNCYLPGLSKQIPVREIVSIQVLEPTLWSGKWRFWGTSTFKIWFAMDFNRAGRNAIFLVNFNAAWFPIGFTVESSADFIRILEERKIPIEYN